MTQRQRPQRGQHPDPARHVFHHTPSDRCWWCGAKATTSEHKFKHSDLRRIASRDGAAVPGAVHKISPFYRGPLRSLAKGQEVKWPKSLCAPCNNSRSQPFDLAYDGFVRFMLAHGDTLHRYRTLDWVEVYGGQWEASASNLARYFVKQFGCLLASNNLAVPQDAIDFLDGAHRSRSVAVSLWRDLRLIQVHRSLRHDPAAKNSTLDFAGLPPAHAYVDGGRLTEAMYQCRLGYMVFDVTWKRGGDAPSIHEGRHIQIPLVNAGLTDRAK